MLPLRLPNIVFGRANKKLITALPLLCLAALVPNWAISQTRLDSLSSLLGQAKTDSVRASLECSIADEYLRRGICDLSIQHYTSAISYSRSVDNRAKQAYALAGIGEAYRIVDKPDLAIENFTASIKLYEQLNQPQNVAGIFNVLIELFMRQGDINSAISYANKSRAILTSSPDKARLAQLYTHIGRIFNNYKEYDSAIYYEMQAAQIFDSLKLFHEKGRALHNMANSYRETGNLKKALGIAKDVITMPETSENTKSRVFSLLLLANIYNDMGQPKLAIPPAQEALQLAKKHKFRDRERVALLYLSQAHELIPDLKTALEYHKQYSDIMDVIYDSTKYEQVAKLMTLYETEKSENLIRTQKANLESREATIELQRTKNNQLFLVIGFIIVVGVILLAGYLNKAKQNTILARQKLEIQRQNLEREVLLKEIHHRVKNNLQVISSLLSMQTRKIKDGEAKLAVREGQSRIKSMSLIHQKLYSEGNLSQINMREYIDDLSDFLFKSYKPDGDIVRTIESEDLMLDVDIAVPIGLIINELISNALKYAFEPTSDGEVKVKFVKEKGEIVLQVSDSGRGLPEDFHNRKSMGLNLVGILVQQLHGEMSINQSSGSLFTITFKDRKAA